MVEANLRLAPALLHRLRLAAHPQADDYLQAALVGLIRAAELFDPTTGYTFATYADYHMRQAIARERERHHLIHVPLYVENRKELLARLKAVRLDAYTSTRGTQAGAADSLPDRRGEDAGESDAALIERMLRTLPDRYARVLRRRLDGMTLQAIGDAMGVSKERVRQMVDKATERLRRRFGGRDDARDN